MGEHVLRTISDHCAQFELLLKQCNHFRSPFRHISLFESCLCELPILIACNFVIFV